jgi:glutathione S-transferase
MTMADELVFYTNPQSRGRIVRWMLEEVGVPYRAELVAFGPPMKGPDYLAVNPLGKVPALEHGGTIVTETAAICAYLADAFPEAGLAPPLGERGASSPPARWRRPSSTRRSASRCRRNGAAWSAMARST